MSERFNVQHRASENRYVLIDTDKSDTAEIGEEQYVDFAVGDATHRVMHHTSVSEQYGGQGLASVLVRYAVEHTVNEGLLVVPVCPYVAKWIEKHPEYSEHVVQARPEHLQAVRQRQG